MDALLTKEERNSALWAKIKSHLEARVAQLRESNDKSLPIEKTEHIRGRIEEAKRTISIGEPKPVLDVDDERPD